MNLLKWHKALAEKMVGKIGLYTSLWLAFIKGVLVTYVVLRYLI